MTPQQLIALCSDSKTPLPSSQMTTSRRWFVRMG
jgi:hypothetical protein